MFMHESIEDMKDTFTKLNFQRKKVCSLTFVKCKVTFDHLSMHEIANLKMSLEQQLEHIDSIDSGGYEFSSLRRATCKMESINFKEEVINNTKDVHVPAHKLIIKDVSKLELASINSSDLM